MSRNCRKQAGACLVTSVDILYEIFTVTLATADVISDVVVAWEFYQVLLTLETLTNLNNLTLI